MKDNRKSIEDAARNSMLNDTRFLAPVFWPTLDLMVFFPLAASALQSTYSPFFYLVPPIRIFHSKYKLQSHLKPVNPVLV